MFDKRDYRLCKNTSTLSVLLSTLFTHKFCVKFYKRDYCLEGRQWRSFNDVNFLGKISVLNWNFLKDCVKIQTFTQIYILTIGADSLIRDKIEQKRDFYIRFINATQELLNTGGLEAISIRKIAEKSALHNSTIYLYFEDLNELILLSSMKYFEKYIQDLATFSSQDLTPNENFKQIWDCFLNALASNPPIFYNFFFGPKSNKLHKIIGLYFEIFPNERKSLSPFISEMFYGSNVYARNLHLTSSLIGQNSRVTPENCHLLSQLMVSFCKFKLEELCSDPSLDHQTFKSDVLSMLNHAYFTSN